MEGRCRWKLRDKPQVLEPIPNLRAHVLGGVGSLKGRGFPYPIHNLATLPGRILRIHQRLAEPPRNPKQRRAAVVIRVTLLDALPGNVNIVMA